MLELQVSFEWLPLLSTHCASTALKKGRKERKDDNKQTKRRGGTSLLTVALFFFFFPLLDSLFSFLSNPCYLLSHLVLFAVLACTYAPLEALASFFFFPFSPVYLFFFKFTRTTQETNPNSGRKKKNTGLNSFVHSLWPSDHSSLFFFFYALVYSLSVSFFFLLSLLPSFFFSSVAVHFTLTAPWITCRLYIYSFSPSVANSTFFHSRSVLLVTNSEGRKRGRIFC